MFRSLEELSAHRNPCLGLWKAYSTQRMPVQALGMFTQRMPVEASGMPAQAFEIHVQAIRIALGPSGYLFKPLEIPVQDSGMPVQASGMPAQAAGKYV